jgi:hypothetical protein
MLNSTLTTLRQCNFQSIQTKTPRWTLIGAKGKTTSKRPDADSWKSWRCSLPVPSHPGRVPKTLSTEDKWLRACPASPDLWHPLSNSTSLPSKERNSEFHWAAPLLGNGDHISLVSSCHSQTPTSWRQPVLLGLMNLQISVDSTPRQSMKKGTSKHEVSWRHQSQRGGNNTHTHTCTHAYAHTQAGAHTCTSTHSAILPY